MREFPPGADVRRRPARARALPRLVAGLCAALVSAAPAAAGPDPIDQQLARRSAEIDLFDAALGLSQEAEPGPAEPEASARWQRYFEGLRSQLLEALPADRAPAAVAGAAARILFAQEGFGLDARWAPRTWQRDFFLLGRVLRRRQGVPLTLSLLVVALLRDTGVPAAAVTVPGHVYVAVGPAPSPILLETTGGGAIHPRAWFDARHPLPEGTPSDIYGRRLSKRELLGLLAHAIGRCQLADQAFDAAHRSLIRAQRLWPQYPPLYLAFGELYIRHADAERAALCFRRAVEFDPAEAEGYRGLGEVALLEGDAAEAASRFREALARNPKLIEAHLGLGRAAIEARALDAALAAYRRAIEIDPHDARAHAGLGRVHLARGEADAAEAALAEAIGIDPACGEAFRLRGELNETLWGDYDAALTDYAEAIRLDAGDARARRLRAVLLDRTLGRPREALADYRAFLELAPRDPWARTARDRMREILGSTRGTSGDLGS